MSYSSQYLGQYPQQPPQQPPYPTTPGTIPTSQPQAYFPPQPQQQQPIYASSPPSQPFYASSPNAQFMPSPTMQPGAMMIPQQHQQPMRHRGSSSSTHSDRPQFQPQFQPQYASSAPIPIAHPQFYQPSAYPRHSSHSSVGSHHGHHHHHAYVDDDDEPQRRYGELDEDTLREYEARYRKDRRLERRPTLGDSVMSMVGKVGGLFGSDRR
jgi:hypothetical protein